MWSPRVVAYVSVVAAFAIGTSACADGLLPPRPMIDPVDALAQSETGTDARTGMSPKLKAMLLSFAVPGLGQYTSGNRGAAYVFFGFEAAIWATNLGFHLQGDSRSDRYEEFAEVWGGVENSRGHDDTYYTNVGRFPTYDEYRVVAERSDGELYAPDMHWAWPNDERRNRFLDLRAAAEDSYQRSEFMLAAALLNRALSMVHAARTVGGESAAPPGHSLKFDLRPDDGQMTPILAWQLRF